MTPSRPPERFHPTILGSITLLLVVAFTVSAVPATAAPPPGGSPETRCVGPRPSVPVAKAEQPSRDEARPVSRPGMGGNRPVVEPSVLKTGVRDGAVPHGVRVALLSLPPPGR